MLTRPVALDSITKLFIKNSVLLSSGFFFFEDLECSRICSERDKIEEYFRIGIYVNKF